jgi:nitroreductase
MEFFQVIKERASVRRFVQTRISREDIEKIVDAGRRAPSGYNRQPWEFIVITEEETLRELAPIQRCIGEAAAAIGVVMDEKSSNFWKEDASAAIENMLLAAVALGYGSLWVEGYVLKQEPMAKGILKVPPKKRLIAILPIGKPAEEASQARKKSLEEITYWEEYGRQK